jgi:hypothetical protein
MSRSFLTTGPLSVLALAALSVPGRAADPVAPPRPGDHWAWKSPRRPAVPAVKDAAWCRTPIDAFVLARLEAAGLTPAAPAPPEQLLRRLTFDLTGLPPTPEQIGAFRQSAIRNPQSAIDRLVEELLASPHYGERWGRHWLDLARYAESNGYEHDEVRPNAWRYRDYVIRAFNANKPFDRFVREQLAGDELFPDDPDALSATGFNLLGPDMTDATSLAERRQNTLNDMTDTAGLAFLGLTLACARCHDHKFEPLPQTDYYRLQAFFTPAVFRHDLPLAPVDAAAQAEYDALVKPMREGISALEEPYRRRIYEARFAKLADEARAAHETAPAKRSAAQKELVEKTNRLLVVKPQEVDKALSAADRERRSVLLKEIERFDARRPAPPPTAMGLQTAPSPAKTFLLTRGELGHPGDEVFAGFPAVVSPDRKPAPARLDGAAGRRSVLAGWVTGRDNPLTARVLVNRVWQHHFGYGLVRTPNDFGVRGDRPTHPELLDWLAVEFMESGWDVKRLHRLILSSAVYQQSSVHVSRDVTAADPDNRLLSRMNRVRLEGEVIRDALLSVSGRLNRTVGGPSVYPPLPPEAPQTAKGWRTSPDPRDHVRRSVYISARRNLRFPFLEAFDLPDSNLSCPRRERSTTAPQALALLNAGDVTEAAKALAARLEREASDVDGRVRLAYHYCLGRGPTEAETRLARGFLIASPMSELCRALFNLNEFVYLD